MKADLALAMIEEVVAAYMNAKKTKPNRATSSICACADCGTSIKQKRGFRRLRCDHCSLARERAQNAERQKRWRARQI